MSSMSSEEKKRMKRPSQVLLPTPTSIPSIPDDLLLTCFTLISKLHYTTLSLVCKRFRSLLSSHELNKSRAFLDRTESCLYVCFRIPHEHDTRWFTLCLKPDQTNKIKKKKSSEYVLATVLIPHSSRVHRSGCLTIGSNIYDIGGGYYYDNKPSSYVAILDFQTHTWREDGVITTEPSASVVDGKIYIAGGSMDCDFSNWVEVFDPKTQTLEIVSGPGGEMCGSFGDSIWINGNVYMSVGKCHQLAHKPYKNRLEMYFGRQHVPPFSFCVIENVFYSYCNREFQWCDAKVSSWKKLKGVEGLPEFNSNGYYFNIADYGGKMAVFWEIVSPSSGFKEKEIWCAVITLEKRNDIEEICGKVEWYDVVLQVPLSYNFVCALAVTV